MKEIIIGILASTTLIGYLHFSDKVKSLEEEIFELKALQVQNCENKDEFERKFEDMMKGRALMFFDLAIERMKNDNKN